jgi:hypothetical protein
MASPKAPPHWNRLFDRLRAGEYDGVIESSGEGGM